MSNEDFYAPEYVEKTVERRGKSQTFRARELTGAEAENLFDLNGKDGKPDSGKMKGLDVRLVATAVTEVNGGNESPINVELANRMPVKLRKELVALVLSINGFDKDAAEAVSQD